MKLKLVWLTAVLSISAIAIMGSLWYAKNSAPFGPQPAANSVGAESVSAAATTVPPGTRRVVETKTKLINYTVMTPVYENHQKEFSYTVKRPVYETKEKTVTYTVCTMVPETKTKTVNYTTCRMVPELKQKTIEYEEVRYVPIEESQTDSK